MATIDAHALASLRQTLASADPAVAYSKAEANAALQAVEDLFHSAAFQTALSNAIDASSSFAWTGAQKKALVKFWLKSKFDRGDV